MKEKILPFISPFIIGVLVGAIIATGVFYFYSKSTDKGRGRMPDGNPPAMMQQNGNITDGANGETPPEKPSEEQEGNEPQEELKEKSNTNSTKKNKSNTEKNNSNTDSSNTI